jgi:trafficking protein particle complex subunit 2
VSGAWGSESADLGARRGPAVEGSRMEGYDDGAESYDSRSASVKPNTRIACVAIISRQNGPLYLKVFKEVAGALPRRPEERIEMQMQEVIYNSLDVVEERISSLKSTPMRDNDGFLGCLAVVGPLSLYGFVTNTNQKFIFALKSGGSDYRDTTVKMLFRKLHMAVVSVLLNPFTSLDEPIKSAAFEARVEEIARRFG